MPAILDLGSMGRNQAPDGRQLMTSETTVPGQHNSLQPELGVFLRFFNVHVQGFTTLSAEEEPVSLLLKHGWHSEYAAPPLVMTS
jgi:hypothetical protein